jgi:Holliday junction resolvase RusA-like endonuclease
MGGELSLKKPDIDNIEKIVLDALNGVAYADDANVVSVRAIKGRYESTPRLIVRVREVEPSELLAMHSFMWADHA